MQNEITLLKSSEPIWIHEKEDFNLRLNEKVKENLTLNNELKTCEDNIILLEIVNSSQLIKIAALEHRLINQESELRADLLKRDAQIKEIGKIIDAFELSKKQLKKSLNDKYSDYGDLKSGKETLEEYLNEAQKELISLIKDLNESQIKNQKEINLRRVLELENTFLELELSQIDKVLKRNGLDKSSNISSSNEQSFRPITKKTAAPDSINCLDCM